MEVPYVAIGCLTTFIAAAVLVGGEARRAPKGLLWMTTLRRLHVMLSWAATTRLVAFLDSRPAWHSLGGELAASEAHRVERDARPGMPRVAVVTDVEQGIAAALAGGALLACVLCLVATSAIGIPIAALVLAVGVPIWDGSRQRREKRVLAQEMPGVFRTLAMAMGSGETLAQAIDYLGSHETGPAGKPFARASLRMRCGDSASEALGGLSEELQAPGVGLLTTALLISQRTGSPLKALFGHAARLVERQGEFERMLEVKTAQVRLSVRIVCGLPVLMIASLSILSPDFRAGLATPAGIVSILLAIGMDATALLIIRRLMRGVV
ncbi:MAG: type II secretion system F family protein [Parafannyhessea sp.]|uniref:type II secretion system F family protein n=1 Tax=Parafannyhessea sp. TaxID=2847324 RepID=UPI003EFD3EC4